MKKRQRNPRAEFVVEAEESPFSVVEVEGSVYFQCNICQQKVLLDEETSEVRRARFKKRHEQTCFFVEGEHYSASRRLH